MTQTTTNHGSRLTKHRRRGARRAAPPSAKRRTVGVIGLGIVGSAIAANLIKTGFEVLGYDILEPPLRRLHRVGGISASDVPQIARGANVMITSLSSSQALLEVTRQIASTARQKTVVIETSTMPLAIKEEAAGILAERGMELLDCPLSGSGSQARTKDIVMYASGPRSVIRRVTPVLEGFVRAHHYVGPFGAGTKMKFAANLLVAVHNLAAAEALVLVEKSGLDLGHSLRVLRDGAGASRALQVRGPLMVKNDYSSEVTTKLHVWQRDMVTIAEFADAIGVATPLLTAALPIYAAAAESGGARDISAVCAVLEERSQWQRR